MNLYFSRSITENTVLLDETEHKHLHRVMRAGAGDIVMVTDGKGVQYRCQVISGKAELRILERTPMPAPAPEVILAVSPPKQMERFEWFLEKAVEMGVSVVLPVICRRSERFVLRQERLEKIMIAAMKQSLHYHLPVLAPLVPFETFVKGFQDADRFIAVGSAEKSLSASCRKQKTVIAIGPEGDFDPSELELASQNNFIPVSLGSARLRTETAALAAVTVAMLQK